MNDLFYKPFVPRSDKRPVAMNEWDDYFNLSR